MVMAVHDIYFDLWFNQIKSNEAIGDEFCLSALCQLYQQHALVVKVEKIWSTIPLNFLKTDDDIHQLYVCRDMYAVLKLVFEWKREIPIGEISLVTPDPFKPLGTITDVQIEKDQNLQNIVEDKQETEVPVVPEESNVQDQFSLINVPPLTDTGHELLDATRNLLVELPDDVVSPMDTTGGVPTVDTEGQPMDATIDENVANVDDEPGDSHRHMPSQVEQPMNLATLVPCTIVLKDVSKELQDRKSFKITKAKDAYSNSAIRKD